MTLINRGINYVNIWFSTLVTFIILWIRKIKPTAALTDNSLVADSIRSTTPQEKFDELLENEEYEEALKTARKYQLNTDPVYKKKWSKSRITTDTIRLLLTPIKNTDWVIDQCLNCTPTDFEANRELLQFGQSLTEELLESYQEPKESIDCDEITDSSKSKSFTNTKDDQTVNLNGDDGDEDEDYDEITKESSTYSSQESSIVNGLEWQDLDKINFSTIDDRLKTLLTARYLFVKYLVRLKSYEKMLSSNNRDTGCINQDYWLHFRSASCFEILIDLAHKSEWRSIKVILSRHGPDTKEHWLSILSNFPETLKPSLYQDLLPSVDTENGDVIYPSFKNSHKRQSDVYDDIDWCYQLCDKLSLEEEANSFIEDFYSRNSFFTDFRRSTLNSTVVSSWFLVRAREIENRSSLVSNAIELLELGIDRNIPELSSFKDDLDTYATLVYQCFPMYNLDDIGFSEFERLSKEERVNLLMLGATGDENRFLNCLNRFLLPYLHKISKNRKEEKELLWDFICNSAKHKLTIVQKIFIDYKMAKELGSVSSQEIIQSDEDLIDYGIKCIYANERTDQLDAALNIVETFPEDESSFFQMDRERNNQVNRLYKRLEVAEILEQYNHFITVSRLDEMVESKDKQGVKSIFNKITREFCRKVDSAILKDSDWLQLLKDLEGMRVACFSQFLPQQDVYEVFIKGILTSGRLEQFKLASNFMQLEPNSSKKKLMSFEKSVETILEAAQHYVNSAASVNDEIIETAKKCLNLLGEENVSTNPGIAREKDFIEALSILANDFDLKILPIQIRLMEDSKIELIHQIISSQPKAYKKTAQLLRLSKILNIFTSTEEETKLSDETNQVKLLSILGNVAYERDDYNHCWSLCKLIMDKGYTSGWRLCELLGNCSSFKNYSYRLKLLSFVVIHCDDYLIIQIISSIRKLKLLLMEESLNCLQSTSDQQESTFSSLTSTSSSLLSSLPTVEITSKLIKSMTRLAADQKDDQLDPYESDTVTIKKQSPSSSSNCYNSINISPFYQDAFGKSAHFQFNVNNYDYNYLGFGSNYTNQFNLKLSNQQIQLRSEMLKSQINWLSVENLSKQLSETLLPLDTLLSLSTIIPLGGKNDELPFKTISPQPPAIIYIGLYFYSLILYLKNVSINYPDDDLPDNPASKPMSAIISKSDEICKRNNYLGTSEKQLIDSYFESYCNIIQSETISSIDPSVDVDRFASEIDYRSDTLLGLAMTTDDKIFNIVITLGKQYSLPLINLYLTHLEFLLTDSTNDVEMIADRIFKNDNFITILTDYKDSLEDYFEKRIFPLVHPDDHNRLVLCYQIIEKFCYPPSPSSSNDQVNPMD
ncbi:NBAS subunit of NRZ tethering complex-like [Panonychus citri]|uniref:NBAS subunit of NRZ tethering complex-like n=1 Tax=Panonychus citri TaxID=50023 RepID=UPI0023081093|nr:NBAS subunit of NRZ tethering complex-like [Panonychus citri]